MKMIFKILSAAILLASANYALADNSCPSGKDFRSIINFQYAVQEGLTDSWTVISDSFLIKDKAWNLRLSMHMPGVANPKEAAEKANEWFKHIPLADNPSNYKGVCDYTYENATSYELLAKSPPYPVNFAKK